MSAEPRPYPTYAPDPPSRFRWVPPLCLGIALGGLIGCVATFAVLELGKRSRSDELVAERFNTSNVLNAVPGAESVTFVVDMTKPLGRYDGRPDSGSGVRRLIRLQGSILKDADPGNLGTQLQTQINAELSRQGAFTSGGSSSSSSGGEYRLDEEKGYHTRDGRRGQLDLHLEIRNGQVHGFLILTEGR
jgi:hypothetical protein